MASLEPNPTLKRQRDDQSPEQLEEAKKHKSYSHILSILDDDEDDPTHDLSSLITTLHQELSGHFPTDPEANSTGIASNSGESYVSGTVTELSGHFPTDPDEKSTGIASNSEGSSESSVSGAVSDISGPIPTGPEGNSTEIAANSEDSLSESSVSGEEEDEKERVMRHLLEASDDELGIPTVDLAGSGFDGGDGFGVLDGLWEFGDESEDCFGLLEPELLI